MDWLIAHINPLYSLSGFAVGMLVGFTGVGGGSLMTPLLVLLFGIHPATAVGTDLLYAGDHENQRVLGPRPERRGRLARRSPARVGSVPAAALTLIALSHFGVRHKGTSAVITTMLGIRADPDGGHADLSRLAAGARSRLPGQRSDSEIALLTVTLGAVLGVLVSISSVGAGAIGVTALLMLYPKMPTVRIVGSDIAHAVPLTLLAGRRPLVDGLGRLAVAGLAAHRLDTGHRHRQPFRVPRAGRVLRPLMAGTLALVGGRLAF